MMNEKKNFYLTTTLPYVNADLHMGHALEFVRADIIARYKKLMGFDVFFNTGTDEHGMKIYEKSHSLGKTPQEFTDESFLRFKESVKIFGMDSGLHFIRTTDAHHEKAAQEFWKRVYDNGYIYKKDYEAKYCVGCEENKSESELVNGECVLHPGKKVEVIKEENYFFKYSAFADPLKKLYESRPTFVVPDFRFKEIKSFVAGGLQDFSISRVKSKMPWGITVPGDDTQVMYVWFDALVNYISTLGWPEDTMTFEKYWVDGHPTQYCGKDNLRFQAAMWQAMLMASGVPNSYQIIINGFITADGGLKMSKTLGNVVDPTEIVKEYGTDALRFFLAKEISNFEDSPFTLERFKDAYNAGLANGIGNLTSRIMKMATSNNILLDDLPSYEDALQMDLDDPIRFSECLERFDIKKGIELLWFQIQLFDGIIQKVQPFKLLKSENLNDREKGVVCIKNILRGLYQVSLLLESIMPDTAVKIQNLIKKNEMPAELLFLRKE